MLANLLEKVQNYCLWRVVGGVKAYRIARALDTIVCFRIRRGFAPERRGPFVSAKVSKQGRAHRDAPCKFWPWHGPSGTLRGSATPSACKLAALKHCPPFLRWRLHCSAMPPGQGLLTKEKEDGSPMTTVGDDGEDVLGDEVIFRLGSDSSAWPQNDKQGGGLSEERWMSDD